MGFVIAGTEARRALRSAADSPLVWHAGQAWTGAVLDALVEDLAGFLQAAVPPGSGVGLWYWNSAHALVAHLAVERAGLTRVPVDPAAPSDEAASIWAAAGAQVILCDSQHAGSVDGGTVFDHDERPKPACVRPVEVEDDFTHLLFPRTVAAGNLLAVPISYRGWSAHMTTNARLFREGVYGPPVGPGDRLLTVQQLMHGTGLVATFPFLHMGLPQVIVEKFDVAAVQESMERYRVTTAFMVPGMVTRLAQRVADTGMESTLRRIVYGGAPITPGQLVHAVTHLGPVLTQIYGRLEGGWPLTVLGISEHSRIAAGDDALADSCGRAVPEAHLELRPVGASGRRQGELRVRGQMTSPAFTDPDGWCSLGDLATEDKQGYFRLHGRLDGMINTGAYHVYPEEVEEAVRALLDVTHVVVGGEPDAQWGEAVTATLTWSDSTSPPADEQIRHVLRQRLAPYKLPTRFHHVVKQAPQ